MDSKATGLSLSLGMLATIVGYILWVTAIGFNTASDDIVTILTNSASGSTTLQIAAILVLVGLVAHGAGLISTRGTSAGTTESLGIIFIISGIVVWITSIGLGIALSEMGEKFVEYSQGAVALAAAGDGPSAATAAAAATNVSIAAGFTQAANIAANTFGTVAAGIGWVLIGLAYRGSNTKGLLSFIPLEWLALLQGAILLVSSIIISNVVDVDTGAQVGGIGFLLIVVWSVLRGFQLARSGK